jgi:hypothetical protein
LSSGNWDGRNLLTPQ